MSTGVLLFGALWTPQTQKFLDNTSDTMRRWGEKAEELQQGFLSLFSRKNLVSYPRHISLAAMNRLSTSLDSKQKTAISRIRRTGSSTSLDEKTLAPKEEEAPAAAAAGGK